MNILCIHVLPMFDVHAGNLLNKRTTELLSIRFCLLCITANWLLVSFSKVEKCTVFSLSCLLLGGVELDQDNNIVLLDEEMASMRQGRAFLSLINDNVPRSLSSMEQMADALEGQRSRPMMERQFENVVLSMVYTAHQAWHEKRKERQEAWGEVLLKLANITVHELRGNHLFRYS
uniref:Family with sequence similarity 180 member A n=1 Tax=Astatotilapia calliptera TaxID=8154 RepID=A0A3P8PVB9_ASTCA